MPPQKQWTFNSNVGGIKIPEVVKCGVIRRITETAEKHFKDKHARLKIYFKNQFCYIDVFTAGLQRIGLSHGKNILIASGTHRLIYAVFDILEKIDGVMPFIPTVMRNMKYVFIPMESFLGNLRMHSFHQLKFIARLATISKEEQTLFHFLLSFLLIHNLV
jgi:hypothetical protein